MSNQVQQWRDNRPVVFKVGKVAGPPDARPGIDTWWYLLAQDGETAIGRYDSHSEAVKSAHEVAFRTLVDDEVESVMAERGLRHWQAFEIVRKRYRPVPLSVSGEDTR